MSSAIPRITGDEAVAAFTRVGFYVARVKGSHYIMKKDGWPVRLSIPCHSGKIIGKGLLAAQIAKAGLTVAGFCELL